MSGILIVDDFPVIRSGLRRILTENPLGLEPVLEAADGAEALQLVRRHHPAIIIMDIKMPGLNGLQAIQVIRAEQPDTKIVILTAYNDFNYVQKALQLGARDYLLKPVRPQKLLELLQEIREEIRRERRELRTIEIVKDSLQKTMPVIEINLVENLVRGTNPEGSTAEESLSLLGRQLIRPAVIVSRIDGYDEFSLGKGPAELQQTFLQLTDLARQELPAPQHALVGYSNPGRVILIVSCDKELATKEQLIALAERYRQAVYQRFPFSVTVGIGNAYLDWDSVPFSYAEANLARRYQRRVGGNTAVHIDDMQELGTEADDSVFNRVVAEQDLIRCVHNGEEKRAGEILNEIMDYLVKRIVNAPEGLRTSCTEVVTLIAWAAIGAGSEEKPVLSVLHQQVHNLSSWRTVPEIRAWAMNSLAEFMGIIASRRRGKNAIQRAVEYVQANYRRSDISLQEVAEAVNLSQSHLASQFRATVGSSYIKYLTTLRVEQAKRLLRNTDLSIAAISEAVGYPNITNFYRHFQNQSGMTPAAFRQKPV
jgi:two-component system response regulator YesN